MITDNIPLKVKGSEEYAKLCMYIQEPSEQIGWQEKPLILLCPGGGYEDTSDREAEALALQFMAMGYHAAVLRYSYKPAVYPTALLEIATAMKIIHEHKKEWHVTKVFVEGCSAGGHLAASLGVFWKEKWLAEAVGTTNDVLRPAGMILSYPVITSGEYAHRGSFENLLAGQYTEEMLERTSLEKQVTADTPEAFIWHTYTDNAVPVENSLLFIGAMRKYQIPVEFHMYPIGNHGLATADRQTMTPDRECIQPQCQSWIALAKTWLADRE